jgi:hypothetical protein
MSSHVHFDQDALATICRNNGIRRLALFGSAMREDFDPGRSDADVLIEFFPDADRHLSYFALARIKRQLEALFNRSVDLALADSLDRCFRDEILARAEDQYVAA